MLTTITIFAFSIVLGLYNYNVVVSYNDENVIWEFDNLLGHATVSEQTITSNSLSKCQGLAVCFNGTVTEVDDGDTLDVNNITIRLALVNAPEEDESGYLEAKEFVETSCGVGTQARVDEDDGQKEGSLGRMIAQVYCANEPISLNQALLDSGRATVYQEFCGVTEFASNTWMAKYCAS